MGTPSPTPDTRLRSGFRDRDGRLRRLLATAAGLSFTIPYTPAGESRQYVPDFIVRVKPDLTLIVEVSGEAKKDKAAKVATARTLWVPAVNNHGGFGRWAFVVAVKDFNHYGDEVLKVFGRT